MRTVANGVFVICVLINCTIPSFSDELSSSSLRATGAAQAKKFKTNTQEKISKGRSIDYSRENVASEGEKEQQQHVFEQRQLHQQQVKEHANQLNLAKKSKPLRNIFMGIYKNYKSTYLGNKTLTEYKQSLRENLQNKQNQKQQLEMEAEEAEDASLPQTSDTQAQEEYESDEETEVFELGENTSATEGNKANKDSNESTLKPENKQAQPNENFSKEAQLPTPALSKEQEYSMGEALNITLDMQNSLVKVNLDGESLKELASGRWLNDNTEEG